MAYTAIHYLRSYPDISEATRVNLLYKKLPTEDRILLDMMRGTATLEKVEEVLRKNTQALKCPMFRLP